MFKKLYKVLTVALGVAVLLINSLPVQAFGGNKNTDTEVLRIVRVNPVYRDVLTEEDILAGVSEINSYTDNALEGVEESFSSDGTCLTVSSKKVSSPYFSSIEDAGIYVRSMMTQRIGKIAFNYSGSIYDVEDIVKKALEHTGVPDEGDYLAWTYAGYSASGGWDGITINMQYYTTYDQEKQVESEVKSVLSALNVSGKKNHEKVDAIYGWITDNVSYDWDTYYGSASGDIGFTAYGAIHRRSAVCQGYASLLYRMLLTAGVDVRIISGKASGGDHGWNIIRIGDLWYNADPTWDAEWGGQYYLKCDANFTDHVRDGEYKTREFYSVYPMSSTDFSDKTAYTEYSLDAIYGRSSSGNSENTSENTGGNTSENTSENTGDDYHWEYDEYGKAYWYEFGVKQGTYEDPKSFSYEGSVRGREIYDSATDAWYWLDAVNGGAKATNKEVFMPYVFSDEESWFTDPEKVESVAALSNRTDPEQVDMSGQVAQAIRLHGGNGSGKWVRYDSEGRMIKGWYTVSGNDIAIYPNQAGNTYYYDQQTGLMAKGWHTIDGTAYHFNETTGVLDS